MSAAAPPPPAATEADAAVSGTVSQAHPASRSRPLILAVDDEPDMLTMLQLYLSAEGFGVVTAANATEALQVIAELGPDLIITDHLMPGITGLGLCRALREGRETRDPPIIVFSACDLWAEDYPNLFDRCVLKPAEPDRIVRLIRCLLAGPRTIAHPCAADARRSKGPMSAHEPHVAPLGTE